MATTAGLLLGERRTLLALGARLGQGFLLGRPAPLAISPSQANAAVER